MTDLIYMLFISFWYCPYVSAALSELESRSHSLHLIEN